MATHSSTLAWKIPWAEEPGGLPYMESHRVEHNWSDLAAALTEVNILFIFFWCLPNFILLFWSPIQDTTLHLVVMSPYALLYCRNFWLSSFLLTLAVLRSNSQAFCKMLHYWNLVDAFLLIKLRKQVLGKK